MTDIEKPASPFGEGANAPRRARVAILGEFSAGKSTFINLITGGRHLRTQVTATQMPAVWMTHGTGSPTRVGLDGTETPLDPADWSGVAVEDTAYIRIPLETPVLELCDLIDTPGNGDPNIAPIAWERIAEIADVAVWCSPATQAWRQSEAAAWAEMPERLRENSVLLLTRSDKLTTDEDREKVLRRVNAEAGHLFGSIHMASLLNLKLVQPAFREVIRLCRRIDVADTPSVMDTAQILQTMAGEASSVTATQQIVEREADDDHVIVATEAASVSDETTASSLPENEATAGFATHLWYRMTDDLPTDDPEALDRAFLGFLSRLDREVAALREIASIGKVG